MRAVWLENVSMRVWWRLARMCLGPGWYLAGSPLLGYSAAQCTPEWVRRGEPAAEPGCSCASEHRCWTESSAGSTQLGSMPGLRHPELLYTMPLCSREPNKKKTCGIPLISSVTRLKSACFTSWFDAPQIAMSQLPLHYLDFINLVSFPQLFKEILRELKNWNHSGYKRTYQPCPYRGRLGVSQPPLSHQGTPLVIMEIQGCFSPQIH